MSKSNYKNTTKDNLIDKNPLPQILVFGEVLRNLYRF